MKTTILTLIALCTSVLVASQVTFTQNIIDSGNSASSSAGLAPADYDGDGDIDLVGATMGGFPIDGKFNLYTNDGTGSFTVSVIDESPTVTEGARFVKAVDVDEDGDMDFVGVTFQTDHVLWYENDGSANFTRHIVDNDSTYTEEGNAIDAGDLDGDGDIDLVIAAGWANAYVAYFNDGSENFTRSVIAQGASGATWTASRVLIEDIDQDGDGDLVTAALDGNIFAWWENDGSGSFTSHIIVEGTMSTDPGFRAVNAAAGDIDGDGDIDIAGTCLSSDFLLWFENDGDENFTTHIIADATTVDGPRGIDLHDLDRDGDMDILCTLLGDDSFNWFENDGSESFTNHVISNDAAIADVAFFIGEADLDGDCKSEVLTAALFADAFVSFEVNGVVSGCCPESATYTLAGWNPAPPTSNTQVTIMADYDTETEGSFNACVLTITTGATLNIRADDYVQVENEITVDGSLIIDHQGSLVQVENDAAVINNGTINVNITSPVLQTRDWMVLGSPMDAETREGVYNSAFLVLQHTPANFIPHPEVPAGGTNFADDNGDFWNQFASGPINVGEGYIVRPQTGYTDPANIAYNFTHSSGTLNNGVVSRTVFYNGAASNPDGTPNVLANPYPSAISAADFITNNSLVNEVYFWEHLTPPSTTIPGAGSMNFSMDDISMYNLSGGTAAANDPGTSTQPNGIISTSQGFGIKATTAGTVTFTNGMRRTTGNNTLRSSENVDRIWLNLRNDKYDLGSNTLIAFNEAGTAQLDPGYDSERVATIISLYSQLESGNEELGIQTLGPLNEDKKVLLGFATQVDENNTYVISLSSREGPFIESTNVYLVDNFTNEVIDLTQEDYTFEGNLGNYPGRFTLVFKDETLGIDSLTTSGLVLYPNPTSGLINVASTASRILSAGIYDLHGRHIMTGHMDDGRPVQIDVSVLTPGMYMIRLRTENGVVIRKFLKK